MLAQIRAPHFTAGIVLVGDKVTETPPIVGYMKGWNRDHVRRYCHQKQWNIAAVKDITEAK